MEIIRFFGKNIKFSLILGPEPPYTPSNELLSCLGGRPPNFRKKLKWQEENVVKNRKYSLASRGPPPNPLAGENFQLVLYFRKNPGKKIHESL